MPTSLEPEQVFAERLRELIPEREGKVYAAKAGVSETTLSRWRSGTLTPNPTLKSMKKLAKALGVPVAYLISNAGEPDAEARAERERALAERELEAVEQAARERREALRQR